MQCHKFENVHVWSKISKRTDTHTLNVWIWQNMVFCLRNCFETNATPVCTCDYGRHYHQKLLQRAFHINFPFRLCQFFRWCCCNLTVCIYTHILHAAYSTCFDMTATFSQIPDRVTLSTRFGDGKRVSTKHSAFATHTFLMLPMRIEQGLKPLFVCKYEFKLCKLSTTDGFIQTNEYEHAFWKCAAICCQA